MARNVEIKAKLDSLAHQFQLAQRLSNDQPKTIHQRDVFFHCESGRLKLRFFSPDRGELIAYSRPNQLGPKTSQYTISRTNEPDVLCQALTQSLGMIAEVKKTRQLFLFGRTRIHLDTVDLLGDFLELEVVLSDTDDTQSGESEARDLMRQLEVKESSLINCAYVDMLLEQAA